MQDAPHSVLSIITKHLNISLNAVFESKVVTPTFTWRCLLWSCGDSQERNELYNFQDIKNVEKFKCSEERLLIYYY